jgi:hypothetical protein
MATYLLNRRSCSAIHNNVPSTLLHHSPPDYTHLHVFGCLCYPNLSATTPHKRAPRSTACVSLSYLSSHKGYRCLDLSTRRIIISHHVVFDESCFPFRSTQQGSLSSMDFLLTRHAPVSPCTAAATPPYAAAPSTSNIEQPRLRPSATAADDLDPTIFQYGPVIH